MTAPLTDVAIEAIEDRWRTRHRHLCRNPTTRGNLNGLVILACGKCPECTDVPRLLAELRRLRST